VSGLAGGGDDAAGGSVSDEAHDGWQAAHHEDDDESDGEPDGLMYHVPSQWLPGLVMDPRDRQALLRESSGSVHSRKIRSLRQAVAVACKRKE